MSFTKQGHLRMPVCILFLILAVPARGQERKEVRSKISYVTASVLYIDAGREEHIAAGDTLTIVRNGKVIGRAAVTAVSKHSSAATVVGGEAPFVIGDVTVIEKVIEPDHRSASSPLPQDTSHFAVLTPALPTAAGPPVSPGINRVSGRIGVQYSGITANDHRFDIAQPSAAVRLDIANMLGTGMVFSLYSRNYYDMSVHDARYGEQSRLKHRIYELSLQHDTPDAVVGYGVGRMTSRYVAAMGVFDGGQAYARHGNITAGVVFGSKIGDLAMEYDSRVTKGAVFVNYHRGNDFLHQYDGTIAYARQTNEGRLDREFLYVQNTLALGPQLSLYGTTEIELNEINRGVRSRAFHMSSTYLTMNYYPVQWFSASAGYDASRGVYLFETMKAFPDTLFDTHIMQGIRGGVSFRLPYYISLQLNGTLRTRPGEPRNSYNAGAALRMSDIAGTEIGAGIRYVNIAGAYTGGNNYTVDIDRTLFNRFSISMRYDHYQFTINSTARTYTTRTVSMNGNYSFSRSVYSTVSVDRVFDAFMNSYRLFAEIGIRF